MQLNHFRDYHPYRLTTKQRKFLKIWEKKRQTPKWKYILLKGVLREGLIFMMIVKLIQLGFDHNAFAAFYFNPLGILFLVFEFFFWLGGGAVIGWFKHRSYETEYEMLKSMEHF